jgi:mannose-6-phosphate isomerase-like protein (cupin superfamily)
VSKSAWSSDRPTGPFDLGSTPIHLGSVAADAPAALPLPDFGFDGPAFQAYVEAHCTPDSPGRLIMVESTPGNWPAWECHTEGDEIVIVLEGRAEFIQEMDGGERRTAVGPGSAIINPKGVWHTADVSEPLKAIYITPCPGTEHRVREAG